MKPLICRSIWAIALALACAVFLAPQSPMAAQAPAEPPATAGNANADASTDEILVREFLVLPLVGSYGRNPVFLDFLEAALIENPDYVPCAGDGFTLPNGSRAAWEAASAGDDGWLDHANLRGGYAFATVHADRERIMILESAAHRGVILNGEPRGGDVYNYNYVHLPVKLHAGENRLFVQGVRGRIRAKFTAPQAPVMFLDRDDTLPDLVVGETIDTVAGIVVVNTSEAPLQHAMAICRHVPSGQWTATELPPIPPLSVRKVAVKIAGPAPEDAGPREYAIGLARVDATGEVQTLATRDLKLDVRTPDQPRKITFVSAIDGSVQYFGLTPAQPLPGEHAAPALVLSLHGASVEGIGQARAYSAKSWGHIVAPTNRRPFGFDWEDWGRWDAIEVLELAQLRFATDPRRVYLTGHSMGGHGTWHVGVTFPDRFAAIAPSAGWISMWSYGGAKSADSPTTFETLLRRSVGASDTMELVRNTENFGVYILHGDADDNVPASEARTMAAKLGEFHHDFRTHFQPGAGHWWDGDDEAGAACVDWPPMFDFFARRRLPEPAAVRFVTFTTASPGVSARCHWVTVAQQVRIMQPSRVNLRFDPHLRRFSGTTENVARLVFDVAHVVPGGAVKVKLDGDGEFEVPYPADGTRIWLERAGEHWAPIDAPSAAEKGPHRYGPFKNAFRHRMVYVVGTRGTDAENRWAAAKARFDAETFWYRGNGSFDIVNDVDFDPTADPDRHVILIGNADTNAAWNALLGASPMQVSREKITFGAREFVGENLAAVFCRPRPGSDTALVAVVGGTGLAGCSLTNRFPYFVSGVGYPDVFIADTRMLREGAAGIVATGFFGNDWAIESGEFAVRE